MKMDDDDDDDHINTKAYNLALSIDATYVLNKEFQLMFLRADQFDTKLAALRLVKHFHLKLQLFGKDKLCRPIVQDDLIVVGNNGTEEGNEENEEGNEEDEDESGLYDGYKQVLPLRDYAGRLVFLDMIDKVEKEDTRSIETRVSYFFVVVVVIWLFGFGGG